jgi:hypothetical protein
VEMERQRRVAAVIGLVQAAAVQPALMVLA